MKDYNKNNIVLARNLRKKMTPQERKLWYQFLSKYPLKFQRQKPIDDYIVDFYCAKAKLAIELDGGQHYTVSGNLSDKKRTEVLNNFGIKVIRFQNQDVYNNFDGVCQQIEIELSKRL